MRSKFLLITLLALLGAAAVSRAFAQSHVKSTAAPGPDEEEAPQLTPSAGQLEFAARYVKAVDNKDKEALRKLIAPKVLACYDARTKPYLDNWLARQMQDQISKPYQVTIEKRGPADLPKSALFTLPVPPTHQINIITRIDGEEMAVGRPIAYQDGQWYEAAPCPTDLGMEHFARRRATVQKKAARIDQLYANLKDPLKSELKTMIEQRRIPDACRKYAAANKVPYQPDAR
jgi:hypothetical protein